MHEIDVSDHATFGGVQNRCLSPFSVNMWVLGMHVEKNPGEPPTGADPAVNHAQISMCAGCLRWKRHPENRASISLSTAGSLLHATDVSAWCIFQCVCTSSIFQCVCTWSIFQCASVVFFLPSEEGNADELFPSSWPPLSTGAGRRRLLWAVWWSSFRRYCRATWCLAMTSRRFGAPWYGSLPSHTRSRRSSSMNSGM